MKNQKRKLKRTTDIESILDDVKGKSYSEILDPRWLATCFAKWPIYDVRIACLDGLKEAFRGLNYLDWARETIDGLSEVGDAAMAKEVLEVYAKVVLDLAEYSVRRDFNGRCEDAPRMLTLYKPDLWEEFVKMIQFVARLDGRLSGPALKIISQCTNPEQFPGCYQHEDFGCIHPLLLSALDSVAKPYREEDWHCAERTIRLIARVGARDYIGKLKDLIIGHERGVAYPETRADRFSLVANLAVLKEAVRTLEKKDSEVLVAT